MIEFRKSPFNERPDFSEFFDEQIYSSYEEYLDMMRLDTTFGDHLTVQAASEVFFVRIRVVSAEGSDHGSIIIPREDADNIPTIT